MPDDATHDFGWALDQMRAGNRVRREGWESFEYITIAKGDIVDEDGATTRFRENEPFLAKDWEISFAG